MQFQYSRNNKLILLTVAIILLLLFLHFVKVLRPFENLAVSATKPALAFIYRISNGIGTTYLNVKDRQALIEENSTLRTQISELMNEKSACLSEREENDFLRKQLNFVEAGKYQPIVANVIGSDNDSQQNTLAIDRGASSGVEVGLAVVSAEGVFLGKVVKVNKNDSFVLLVNDDRSKVAVKIQNAEKTMGLAQGEYGLGIRMNLIAQTEVVREGDIVVTSGLEQKIPGNLIVGSVERVSTSPEELFQEASIKSAVDFSKVTMVSVIKKNNAD